LLSLLGPALKSFCYLLILGSNTVAAGIRPFRLFLLILVTISFNYVVYIVLSSWMPALKCSLMALLSGLSILAADTRPFSYLCSDWLLVFFTFPSCSDGFSLRWLFDFVVSVNE